MKRTGLILVFIFLFSYSIIYAGEKVKFNPTANTLEISEVYALNNPSICFFNIVLNIVPDSSLPYGILLKFTPTGKESYSDHGGCDTSSNTPYYDGVANSLIIPEFKLNGKTFVINLKIFKNESGYIGFYLQSVKEKSTINYNKEELIGYCADEINGQTESCLEFYYIQGNADKESVKESVKQYCKYMNSELIEGQCPIHNNFTYACKMKLLNDVYQITYDKIPNLGIDIINKLKDSCEKGGGEFIKGNY